MAVQSVIKDDGQIHDERGLFPLYGLTVQVMADLSWRDVCDTDCVHRANSAITLPPCNDAYIFVSKWDEQIVMIMIYGQQLI
eukprot:scaffold86943_cov42-Prasinocladus_malaysianus.AAC.1